MGKLKEYFKTFVRTAVIINLALATYAIYDFKYHRLPEANNYKTPCNFFVEKYQVKIGDKKKYLILTGETHIYNRREYEKALELMRGRLHYISEAGEDNEELSLKNKIILNTSKICAKPIFFFYSLGSCRIYPSLSDIAEEKGYKILPIESGNKIFDEMSTKTKITFVVTPMILSTMAPLSYFSSEEQKSIKELGQIYEEHFLRSDRRDQEMAQNIVNLLKQENVCKVVGNFGGAHFAGVRANLEKMIEMEMVE